MKHIVVQKTSGGWNVSLSDRVAAFVILVAGLYAVNRFNFDINAIEKIASIFEILRK